MNFHQRLGFGWLSWPTALATGGGILVAGAVGVTRSRAGAAGGGIGRRRRGLVLNPAGLAQDRGTTMNGVVGALREYEDGFQRAWGSFASYEATWSTRE